VFLQHDYPHYALFRDALFTGPKYASFGIAVQAASDTPRQEDPHLVAIAKAVLLNQFHSLTQNYI